MSIAVIVAEFHGKIAEQMTAAARLELRKLKIKDFEIIKVSGSFEIPLVAQKILDGKATEAAVVLGYIEKGETLHGEIMGQVVFHKLLDLSLKHRKPVGFGIIGPGATLRQAKVRAHTAARQAVRAAVRNLEVLKELT